MSSDALPISAAQFSQALHGLPIENLYSKAIELQNSISHLLNSNIQLQEYSDSVANDPSITRTYAEMRPEGIVQIRGDPDCLDAIRENDVVIKSQRERIDLLKDEVVRRGGRWHEDDGGVDAKVNGRVADDEAASDSTEVTLVPRAGEDVSTPPVRGPGGRLTDEELRRQLAAQMGDDEEDGMHL